MRIINRNSYLAEDSDLGIFKLVYSVESSIHFDSKY